MHDLITDLDSKYRLIFIFEDITLYNEAQFTDGRKLQGFYSFLLVHMFDLGLQTQISVFVVYCLLSPV